MSKRVVLLGQPVTHSLSEALQEAAFAAAGIDAHYEPIDTPPVDLAKAIKALRGEEYLGANIGHPHKDRVVPLLDRLTDEAQVTGAVDTITRDGDQLVGHNLDVRAFKPALEELVGNQKMPRNAVVIGAGGGGRAAIYALISMGFQNIALFNRHLHRGERLVKHFARSASHMDLKADPGTSRSSRRSWPRPTSWSTPAPSAPIRMRRPSRPSCCRRTSWCSTCMWCRRRRACCGKPRPPAPSVPSTVT